MILSDKKAIQRIVLALAKLGLRNVVICPGSRNAPLVISFNRHPDFHCVSIRDERSAGFYALGKAIETRQPVAIVCTSGSATLNFAPAVVEAYYQRIPLLILTADRPKEWTDQGDGQTINQTNIYHNYIRRSYDLRGDATDESDIWFNDRSISEGYHIASVKDRGPVHFNIPMHEPLYGTGEVKNTEVKVFSCADVTAQLSQIELTQLATQYAQARKVMILVGQHPKEEGFQKVLSNLAQCNNTIVLTESTANVAHPSFIAHIDRCITHLDVDEAADLMPDLLITVGDAIVSKRIKSMLRKHRPAAHWNIHPYDATMDTYQSLTTALHIAAVPFLHALSQQLNEIVSSGFRQKWLQLKEKKDQLHRAFSDSCAFSDFKVFDILFKSLPKDVSLHLANSSPIRYAQLFDYTGIKETHSNRGTSGIEGCTSTAIGAAAAAPEKQFLLITGDVAFHYDSNALWNEEPIDNLNIVIINNSGGGIFRIIPGPDTTQERARFLETSMKLSAEHLAHQYKWKYMSASDTTSLHEILPSFFGQNRTILEVFTDADTNPQVLAAYWDYLQQKH